jgi:BirA family transcriptional regulator, biotin operon repressor / biotin---[acetyl-CoA-carboxylase] ligase
MLRVISEVKGLVLEIIWLDELVSTQTYLVDAIKNRVLVPPICIVAKKQTAGIGSKQNNWEGYDGNLYFSFSLPLDNLPKDLPRQSVCIYFLYIFKKTVEKFGVKPIIKWPNDLYVDGKKVCGALTNIIGNFVICGIGLNIASSGANYGYIEINATMKELLIDYFEALDMCQNWTEIFSEFEVEFHSTVDIFFNTHLERGDDLKLLNDGSLSINGERVFGTR